MSKIQQTRSDLIDQLKDQVRLMQLSSKSFDAGEEAEAKRLATHLRILLHDTNSSHSLLAQLNIKPAHRHEQNSNHMLFYDTAEKYDWNSDNLIKSFDALTMMHLPYEQSAKYVAPLDKTLIHGKTRKVAFFEWWFALACLDFSRNQFSRKRLILAVANQDGGAHVDSTLNSEYHALSRDNSMGWDLQGGGAEILISLTGPSTDFPKGKQSTPVFPSIRQMSYEVLESLREFIPEVFE